MPNHFRRAFTFQLTLVTALLAGCGFTGKSVPPANEADPNGSSQEPSVVGQATGSNAGAPASGTPAQAGNDVPASEGATATNANAMVGAGVDAAVRCDADVTLVDKTSGQDRQDFAMAYPNIDQTLVKAIQTNCSSLFARQQDVPARKAIRLNIVKSDFAIAYASEDEKGQYLTLTTDFFLSQARNNNAKDGIGALHHEAAHLYQDNKNNFPGWAIEGQADYVRLRSGYVDPSKRQKGGNYTDAYNTTAFFFDYLEKQHPGIMQKMTVDMAMQGNNYDPSWFVREAGASLDNLWAQYQKTL